MKNLGLLFGGLSFFSYLRGHEYSGPVKDICAVAAGERFGRRDGEKVGQDYFPRGAHVLIGSDGVWKLSVENQTYDHSIYPSGC